MKVHVKKSLKPEPYRQAYSYMQQYQQAVIEGKKDSMIWLLEHEDIITAGRGVKEEILSDIDIEYTDRGGKLTYHGPGQRIIYMILDLKKLCYPEEPDIRSFIRKIMEWLKFSLKQVGVISKIDHEGIGLWCNYEGKEYKIVSLGLKVCKWVTSHGVAINVFPDLKKFYSILPCGLNPDNIGSIAQYLKRNALSVDFIDKALLLGFKKFFGVELLLDDQIVL